MLQLIQKKGDKMWSVGGLIDRLIDVHLMLGWKLEERENKKNKPPLAIAPHGRNTHYTHKRNLKLSLKKKKKEKQEEEKEEEARNKAISSNFKLISFDFLARLK